VDIKRLFEGIAVIIDDEINEENSSIMQIKRIIENKNIPVLAYNELPKLAMIPSLAKASFIILDWDYSSSADMVTADERVMIPDAYRNEQENALLAFIQQLLQQTFMPVFIFTFKPLEDVTNKLRERELWSRDKPNRIFVQQKSKVSSEDHLFVEIQNWMKEMPSVYVLKEWEGIISLAKTAMFSEMFGYSPQWATVLWDMLKTDSIENHREFGDFISRSLLARISGYAFDEDVIVSQQPPSREELRIIAQGERYIRYESQPEQAYAGDLFKIGGKYCLNIRAQCDLSRSASGATYNPTLYCIIGEKLRSKDIVTEDIRFTSEGELVFGNGKKYTLDQMRDMLTDVDALGKMNGLFARQRNTIFFRHGTFLERTDNVIVGCIADEEAIQFGLEIINVNFAENKDKRIGRVLPPYIERVQQKCAHYMIREGTMPIPHAVYAGFDG
jgi:hypothetical protein